jgi:futalosine hydrolase
LRAFTRLSDYGSRVILVVAATERELAGLDGAAGLVCGIGPVEAAAATARALATDRPTAVVNVGIAGAKTLEPTALVLGSEALYCDIAADPGAVMPRVESVRPDAALLEAARRALPDAHVSPIATCAAVGGGSACEVEAMEGFAVLRAAELAGVPALELRCVSNLVDERDRAHWRSDDAFAALAAALPRLLAELGK